MIRIFSAILGIILAGMLGVGVYTLAKTTCAKPLPYRIGSLDARFGLPAEELKGMLLRVEEIWEKAAGKDLLAYRPGAPLAVNFVFDERQIRTLESKKLSSALAEVEASQKQLHREYQDLSQSYEERLAEYRKKVRQYEEDVRDFNEQASYWNSRGGAPEDEYEELADKEKELGKRAADIERDYRALQKYAKKSGTLAEKETALIESYNQSVETFRERFGEAREFDQGLYTGDAITIYQFSEETDLTLALAHEFGHALQIGHVADPAALMYPVLEKQNIAVIAPTQVDLQALAEACALKEHILIRKARAVLSKVSG